MIRGLFQSLFQRRKNEPATAAVTPAPPSAGDDRRDEGRRWGDPVEILVWYQATPKDKATAWVLNRSPGGIGFSLDQEVPEGSMLGVRPTIAPETLGSAEVEVLACQPQAGRFMLSCRFTSQPSDELRALFR